MTKEQREQLHKAMAQAGWIGLEDIFGSVHSWKFKLNGKTISNKIVEDHWLTHSAPPVPF